MVLVDPNMLPKRGPSSQYEIDITEGHFKGKVSIQFEGEPFKVSRLSACVTELGRCAACRELLST